MTPRATSRALLRASCIFTALNLALLAGCAQPIDCDPDTNYEWDSLTRQRAALAIECDAHEIKERISTVAPDAAAALHGRTDELTKLALDAVRADGIESSRLPLSPAHQQMYAVAAEAERESGLPSFIAWPTNPWDPLHPIERPLGTETGALSTALMPGERRALALNVRTTAAHDSKFWIHVNLAGLAPDALQIYQVNWTGTDESDWVAAELELLGDASSTREASVLPGVTRQIWIEVQPDVVTRAGQYNGIAFLSTPAGAVTQIPIEIKIFSTPFARPSMHFGGWDYSFPYRYPVRETNLSRLVEYLQQRYVDTPWAMRHDKVMSWENLDSNGNTTAPLDTSNLAVWLSQWPSARRFGVHLYVSDDIAGIPVTDSRFTQAVATWAHAWATEIRRLNKSPEEFYLLLVDEPQTDEQFRTTELWATAIRQSGAGFRIWTDLVRHDPAQLPERLFDVVDSVAVYLGFAELKTAATHRTWARTLSEREKTLEIYAFDGPARRLDPYTYYRLTSWRAFFMGATAVSFWSFTDTRGTPSDNEFAANDLNYSPLFISDEFVRPGKHMEAAAEGIQDTQYLEMLKQVATAHPIETVRQQAQQLLDELARFVQRSPQSSYAEWRSQSSKAEWRSHRKAKGVDEYRVQIGEFLDSLAR